MTRSAALMVVNYGSHALVAENIAQTRLPSESLVIVVDNFTTHDERRAMQRLAEDEGWVLLTPESNLGFGGGMNIAAAEAISRSVDVLVLLNPDAHLRGDGFERLRDAVGDSRSLVAPVVVRPNGAHFSSEMEVDLADGRIRKRVDDGDYVESAVWVSGACFAVSAELWQVIGGFDDDYFLYWEDVDFSVRATRAGARIDLDDSIVAVHSPGGTQNGRGSVKSSIYYRFNTRNRLVFAAKHVSRASQRRWVATMPVAAWNVVKRGGRWQLIRPWTTLWPVAVGSWEGWRYLRRHRIDEERGEQ